MRKSISLKNVGLLYEERPALESVLLRIVEGDRLCMVGENGAGKSTLLKLIAGTLPPTSGTIERSGHVRTYYVPQEFEAADLALTIEEFVTAHAGIALFKKTATLAARLGFPIAKSADLRCQLLSGGQQKILMLATAIAAQPDFLLLDEPENHLDIVSRLELIALIQEFRGGVLFVSHDRLMIDSLAQKVAEVARGRVYLSEGGYEDYLETRLSRIKGLERAYSTEEKRIKQLREMVVILGQKAFRGKETAAYHRAKDELAELRRAHKESGRPSDRRTKISLSRGERELHSGKLLCRIKDASFVYPQMETPTFARADLEIRAGKHIVLLGRNGSGKSTFLKCLMGKLPLSTGTVTWAPDLKLAHFDQHTEFEGVRTPVEIVMTERSCLDEEARAMLGAMKFDGDAMETPINELSGGQRMRVRFALAFGAKPDFLVLDEPTNHLDEITWEILLEACNASKSTILLVTHDHEFIEGEANKLFWVLQKHRVSERHKTLDELVEELRA
ncbi:MAG: ABC-F family ATP-binding cassette domain-containing protein [Minisyncoccia bacterium]